LGISARTAGKDVVLHEHVRSPAGPGNRHIPRLLHGRALDPQKQAGEADKDVPRDDEEPDKGLGAALGEAQQGDGEAGLGPDGGRGREGAGDVDVDEKLVDVRKRKVPDVAAEAETNHGRQDGRLDDETYPGGNQDVVIPPEVLPPPELSPQTEGEEEGGESAQGPGDGVHLDAVVVVREARQLLRRRGGPGHKLLRPGRRRALVCHCSAVGGPDAPLQAKWGRQYETLGTARAGQNARWGQISTDHRNPTVLPNPASAYHCCIYVPCRVLSAADS